MQYMLLIYPNDAEWDSLSPAEQGAIHEEYLALRDLPEVVGGNALQPGETARTVRVRDGRRLTTDGPFVETTEVLGGYYLVEADDEETALEIAARIPAARRGGAIEVRPIVPHLHR
jgi:hypothetical protein